MLEVLSWWISPLLAELHGKSVLNQNMIGWPWTWNKRHQMRWMLSRWLDGSVEKSKGYFSLISNFQLSWFFSVLKMLFNFFIERGRERERWGEISISCLSFMPRRRWTCNPGMCPDWESNQRPFALQDNAQPTEPHQPGLLYFWNHTSLCS